ncbi:MAG: nitrous oxide-stimulated promoter family protein [Candidatus Bathyarchaeota archaeon]
MVSKVDKDIQVLRDFIQIYCETKHKDLEKIDENGIKLCVECHETLRYSTWRREVCPQDPKPTCKNCEIHCYLPDQRAKIKNIMRHSGMLLIKRGRIDLLLHYFF